MPTPAPPVTFTTVLAQAAGKQATGVVVPPEVIEKLDGGKRPSVHVTLNGYGYRTTLGVMAGTVMIPVSAAIREQTGLRAGDTVDVALVVDASPREVEVPDDFAAAMHAEPSTRAFFDGLSNSLQRYHVDLIAGAKAADTRQRRIDKAIALFRDGKKR